MSSTSTSSSKGFARNAKAPASSAVWRTDGSSRPLMKIIRVSGESRRRQACTSRPFMSGIHTSRTATRHVACSSLERKAAGRLNFSTIKPAEFINRPSALSTETSSSRSQIPSQAEALKGEPFAANFSKALREFVLGVSSPMLFIDSWRGIIYYYYGASFDAALWDLGLIPSGALEHEFCHAFYT